VLGLPTGVDGISIQPLMGSESLKDLISTNAHLNLCKAEPNLFFISG